MYMYMYDDDDDDLSESWTGISNVLNKIIYEFI